MKKDNISEMARVMCGREKDCLVCPIQSPCLMRNCAELLNAEGYCKQSEWISVDDRLPDNYRSVLVSCKGTSISGGTLRAIGSYGGGFWSLAGADGTHYLNHC